MRVVGLQDELRQRIRTRKIHVARFGPFLLDPAGYFGYLRQDGVARLATKSKLRNGSPVRNAPQAANAYDGGDCSLTASRLEGR